MPWAAPSLWPFMSSPDSLPTSISKSPHPDTALDLFLPQHPTYHRLVVERAVPVDFLGAGIKVITATDLVVFKALFNRSKDWVDIEALITESTPDIDEALRWLSEFLPEGDSRISRLRALP